MSHLYKLRFTDNGIEWLACYRDKDIANEAFLNWLACPTCSIIRCYVDDKLVKYYEKFV